jgi:uncharacterized protein (TIGR03086 family)
MRSPLVHGGRASACDGWAVRDLADHVIGGNRFAVDLLSGATPVEAFTAALDAGFEGDPVELARESAEARSAAFGEPGAPARSVLHPLGPISGAEFLGFRVGDLVLHGWDLARSIGADRHIDDALVDFTLEAFEADVHGLLASGAYGNGPNGPDPSDAPNLVRLLELTGRRLGPPQTRR